MNDPSLLGHYLSRWNLTDPQLLTQTMTSQIYIVRDQTAIMILKLLSSSEEDEQRGAMALQYFDGHGAVRLIRADAQAQLMEYAAGEELVTLVERGEDAQATGIIAQVVTQLHSAPQPIPPSGLVRLDRWFEALFRQAARDRGAGSASIYVRGAANAARLLNTQREIRVLHGDIHHRNIRQSARGWLAFDPKGLIGERTYDCANALCNPVMPELVHNEARLLTTAAIFADTLVLDRQRVLAWTFAYACLNASWWLHIKADNADEIVQWSLTVAHLIEPHLDQR